MHIIKKDHPFSTLFRLFALICVLLFSSVSASDADDLRDSVVKIFTTTNPMDFYRPWQSKGIGSSGGSGVIISPTEILTNAHVVSDQTFIQVKKNGDPQKYTATLKAIGHDCDLALLTVDDPQFFKGVKPVAIGQLPRLQDTVTVLGFPMGGEKLSVTEGVISRIEISTYAQSARNLLAVQIDAAINSGNSGGPVMQNGKLVGIAMQVYNSGQNIGYMIPTPVIKHFFKDLEDGLYDGFPMLGMMYTNTENQDLRTFYGIEDKDGGVLITKILPFSPAEGILEEGDVLLKIDDVKIGEDGTFLFRKNERLSLPYLISNKQAGDQVAMTIVRNAQEQVISIPIDQYTSLVPHPRYFERPPYYIYGGLVFTVLSTDLLKSWGKNWWEKSPLNLRHYLMGSGTLNQDRKEEIVVLLKVLSDGMNIGYHGYNNEIMTHVNGTPFKSFKEFVLLLQNISEKEPYVIFKTEIGSNIILKNKDIKEKTRAIIERNHISLPASKEVLSWVEDH